LVVGLFVDLGFLVEKQLQAQAPKLQAELGRNLRFGRARLKLLPSLRLELHDVAVEAAPGQSGLLAQPLVQLGALRVRVAIAPLVFSFGRRVEVSAVEIADLRVQVVRTADGRLSYQDVLDKLATRPESPPPTPEEIERLGNIVVHRAALSDAGIYFYDLSTPTGAAAP